MLTALSGVRVLDLTRILAGPFATLLLADLGAEVIKIERPDGGDDTRRTGPHFLHGESVYFMAANRAKRSLTIDLSRPEGREILHALVPHADVLIENFRPGVAAKLGADPNTLHAINPRMIVCSMTAFGNTGPDRDLPAFDLTLQARGGTMGITGEPGRMPVRMGPPMGDLAGGLYAALGISVALVERARTGVGTTVDLSLLDCQVSLLSYAAAFYLNAGAVLGPQGSAHAFATPYQAFATQDDPIVVAVFTDRFWEGFCNALEMPVWKSDSRYATGAGRRAHRDELISQVEVRLRERTSRAWLQSLYEHGVPAAPVQSVAQVFQDPQVHARAMVAEVLHPVAGAVKLAGNPLKIGDDWESEQHPPPPTLGQHTDEVLREWLQWDDARIARARQRGIIG